jgi:uncharacterized protein with FMN-binding domain
MVPPQEGPKVHIPPVHEEKKSRRKFSGSLLALSAAAITSIYTVGYVSTQASVDKLAADAGVVATDVPAQTTQRTVATNASPPTSASTAVPASPTTVAGAARTGPTTTTVPASPTTKPATATASPAPSTTASPAPSSGYKDGTFVGVGTSRHGSIQATVVIQNGRIASASISSCNTRYPCSDVASLVKQVVSQQAVPVNHVSGATDSSSAFKSAVSKALTQAKQG